jgi:hypothetical protein
MSWSSPHTNALDLLRSQRWIGGTHGSSLLQQRHAIAKQTSAPARMPLVVRSSASHQLEAAEQAQALHAAGRSAAAGTSVVRRTLATTVARCRVKCPGARCSARGGLESMAVYGIHNRLLRCA